MAQRFSFNVGYCDKEVVNPEGMAAGIRMFNQPFGNEAAWGSDSPTLKRWAIVRCPSGTKGKVDEIPAPVLPDKAGRFR